MTTLATNNEGAASVSGLSRLCLLGGPYVMQDGRRCNVPEGSKRLLAYVALHGGRADRRRAAGTLWPDGADDRAAGNLRSALWRLKCAGIEVLSADKLMLTIRAGTVTDVTALCEWAGRVIAGNATGPDLRVTHFDPEAVDILPGWYDDWVICERERIRQRLLHGMESLSRELVRVGRIAEAVEAAIDAVWFEPLRESAQEALIRAHLAEGNQVEALRAYDSFDRLIRRELGVAPSSPLTALVRALTLRGTRSDAGRPDRPATATR